MRSARARTSAVGGVGPMSYFALPAISTRSGGATVASAYSPRARPGVPVSFPLEWDELDDVSPGDFTVLTAVALMEHRTPWVESLPASQRLLPPARTITVYHRIQPWKLHARIERILHHEDRVIHPRRRVKREKKGQLPKRHQKERRKKPCAIRRRSPRIRKS